MRQTICPICKSSVSELEKPHQLILCQSCGVTWTYLPENVDVEALYTDEVYEVVDNRDSIFEKIIFREGKFVLQTLEKLTKAIFPKRVLDFGCGKGQFLFLAKAVGWKTFGIETSKPRAKFAQEKYGLEVSDKYYAEGRITNEPFDVITLFHVLEHLPDPIELITELTAKNLKPNGILVVEVPNHNSWQSKMTKSDWMHLDIPKHLTHWNYESLIHHFSPMGFTPLVRQHFSVHLGVLGMLRAIMGKLGYKNNLILALKKKKSFALLLFVSLVLPFAIGIETLAARLGKGGIIRVYFKKNEQ